ncbi:MAG: hypothetical protein AAFR04_00660 [Pseudomonadota bacterium]
MTRRSLNRTLRSAYVLMGFIFIAALAMRFLPEVPGLVPAVVSKWLQLGYDVVKDMALIIVTVVAAILTNVFQQRASFVSALEREWRNIVRTKTALLRYCRAETPTTEAYLDAYGDLSAAIDNMRIVYRNVGETRSLVGLYPYEPLHDMRRVMQWIDPARGPVAPQNREVAARAIQQVFSALREHFLDELDLEEPVRPILVSGADRTKQRGASRVPAVRTTPPEDPQVAQLLESLSAYEAGRAPVDPQQA